MNTKAGEAFRCACCNEERDQSEAVLDPELGPVCESCRRHIRNGLAWLKQCIGPIRPMTRNDINDSNYKRFMP